MDLVNHILEEYEVQDEFHHILRMIIFGQKTKISMIINFLERH